jgi:hypothetical protein
MNASWLPITLFEKKDIDPESYARELGVLQEWEAVVAA